MENYMNHFWLGNNELVIIRYQERYRVIEMYGMFRILQKS